MSKTDHATSNEGKRLIANVEAKLARARLDPPGLLRDCRIASLTAQIETMRMILDQICKFEEIEAQFGGPIEFGPISQDAIQELADFVEAARHTPKPH